MASPMDKVGAGTPPSDLNEKTHVSGEASSAPKFNLYGDEDRDRSMLLLKSGYSNPAFSLLGLLFNKLRKAEREYKEKREAAPDENNPKLARNWFWRILIIGILLPTTSLIGLFIGQAEAAPLGEALSNFLVWIVAMSILSVPPFLAYAIHSRNRLRHDHSQLRPVKGGLVGLSAVYAFFYIVFLPWGVALGSQDDPAGMAQVFVVYLLFVVPLVGLGALVLGRKLAPPHLPVWVGGQLHEAKPENSKSSSDPT